MEENNEVLFQRQRNKVTISGGVGKRWKTKGYETVPLRATATGIRRLNRTWESGAELNFWGRGQ